MPDPSPRLDAESAAERVRSTLAPGGDRRLGLEIEWLVFDRSDPRRPVPADEVMSAATRGGPLPGGGSISVEPGGQLELSSPHRSGARAAADVAASDAAVLDERLTGAGLRAEAIGLDPVRSQPLTVRSARYLAIERVFERVGPSPMHMATNSAGAQVNVDLGSRPVDRWRTATMLGPVLVALFANSPAMVGRVTGWASTRMLLWSTVPDGRARPVPAWRPEDWVDHVLDTSVLMVRRGPHQADPVLDGLTFRRWIDGDGPDRPPTVDDLDEHLTTLWPPVRPRGWLELRMIDSVPEDGLRVALALAETLVARHESPDPELAAAAAPVAGRWQHAARHGCRADDLATAGDRCLRLAAERADDTDLAARCRDWAERYPGRRRTPADDALSRWGLNRP